MKDQVRFDTSGYKPFILGQPSDVYFEVAQERNRQHDKWGQQNHHPLEWLAILGEEVGEACKAACEANFAGYHRTGDYSHYRAELVQVAAVAIAMIESYDRMNGKVTGKLEAGNAERGLKKVVDIPPVEEWPGWANAIVLDFAREVAPFPEYQVITREEASR